MTGRCRDSSDSPKTWSYSAARMSVSRRRGGEASRRGAGPMLATRCRDRCPATGADHVASPAVAVALAGSNTVTMAAAVTAAITNTVTTSITITVASTVAATVAATGSSTAAPSSGSTAPSATPTVREGRGCRQGGHHQSEHEHSESCHVAAPP